MAQSKIKIKIVEFVNNLLPSKPKQYKPALQTPTVVSSEKFIENIAKETGLSKFQASNVLSCIFQTAGDYMELGNAVQLHEDFGTLKPYIKVKAVSDKDKCNAECIYGMGLRLIPTGKMRSLLSKTQFVFTGMSSGGDVEDSEIVDPNDPNGGGDDGDGDGTGGNDDEEGEGDDQQQQTPKVTYVFKHQDKIAAIQYYTPGETVVAPEAPDGYEWGEYYTTAHENYDQVVNSCELHTVTFMHNGEVYATIQRGEGLSILTKAPTAPEGYAWVWNSDFVMGTEDRVIESVVCSYDLVLKHNGSTSQTLKVEYGTTLASVMPAAASGYHWVGVPETMPAARFSLWDAPDTSEPEYLITYYLDGKLWAIQGYTEGQTITKPNCGYQKHWANLPETMPAENLTIYSEDD